MLRTLEAFGLGWDGEVDYQSRSTDLYARGTGTLRAGGLTFECSCSRRERSTRAATRAPAATGRGGAGPIRDCASGSTTRHCRFDDRLQGRCGFALREARRRRRPAPRRRFAYQLAVVVDDALQGITDVVRGADLLDSTPWQIALQRALRCRPRATRTCRWWSSHGRQACEIPPLGGARSRQAGTELLGVLRLLGHAPPADLKGASPAILLEWAVGRWRERSAPRFGDSCCLRLGRTGREGGRRE